MKRVLVTTDFSNESKAVCSQVRALAELAPAGKLEVVLLYVLETPVLFDTSDLGVSYTQIDRVMEEATASGEEKIAEFAQTELSGLPVTTVVKRARGQIHEEIAETAKEAGVDMIVIATHGRTGFQRLVLGSIAEKVIRVSSVPVLVVPIKDSAPAQS